MAIFDLLYMRTYHTGGIGGINGKRYYFEKGNPKVVDDPADAALFRGQPEIFVELDSTTFKPVVPEVEVKEQRSYKRFREQNILPEDAEALLQKVHEEIASNPQPRNIDHLLELTKEDTILKAEIQDTTSQDGEEQNGIQIQGEDLGTITSNDVTEKPSDTEPEIRKERKLAPNTCPKCARKFKTKAQLDKHLEDHEDRE